MIKYRINKVRVEKELARRQMNHSDFAREIGMSRARLHYILNKGSKKYAPLLAGWLNLKPEELIRRIV